MTDSNRTQDDNDGLEELRAGARALAASLPSVMPELPTETYERVPLPDGAPVDELFVYRPRTGPSLPGVFVNLHGGGFVLGDASDDDRYCRFLADGVGCVVVNVDYVLAPEHKFPAAVEQVHALLTWLAEHGADLGVDGSRLAVGGHSAGGSLAAAACLLAKERGGPPLRGQLLDYPPLDLATPPSEKAPARSAPSAPGELDAEMGARYNAWYLHSPADATNPLASPLLAPDLTGLPPALVITAELDMLREDGDRYAERLAAAGVETEHLMFPGCNHAFTHSGPQAQAIDAWRRMVGFLRRVLA